MKAVFNVPITKPGGGIRCASKEVEIDFIPVAGMLVEDLIWKSPVKVLSVCYGIESKDVFVSLEVQEAMDSKDQESLLEGYKDCGWKAVGE